MTELKIGQIWHEVDPRSVRFIKILDITNGRRGILIRTVTRSQYEKAWIHPERSKNTHADRERFNGKRGGYALYEDCE